MTRRWVLSLLLLMGIVGYFTVPSITHYIVQTGSMGAKLWRTNLSIQ